MPGCYLRCEGMDENTKQALDIIRRKGPKLSLITITNDCVKGILEQLTQFAFDQSNNGHNQRLRQSIRVYAINCLGIIPLTADKMSSKEKTLLISNEAKRLFQLTVNNHFPEITPPQIDALFKSIEEAGTICGSELTDAWFTTSGAGC